jgi:hypothetical protein
MPNDKSVLEFLGALEGNLPMNRLEFIARALRCFHVRKFGQRNAGDVAYSLMGLLSIRPIVDPSGSSFQAFARLSLANQSEN